MNQNKNTTSSKTAKSKTIYDRTKVHLNVGTLGHVDHGKTTLTACLTAYCTKILPERNTFYSYDQIDKAPEEKKRGITINASVISYETEHRHFGHVDCPGHRDYVKNMITGAAQIDAAILVIAANDGIKPQTREHLILARQLEIPNIVVYLNKMDLATNPEDVELIKMDIEATLEEHGYKNIQIIEGSAGTAEKELLGQKPESDIGVGSIAKLLAFLANELPDPVRDKDKPVYLPIEHVYSIEGRGTVITGKVETGVIKPGDYELLGSKTESNAKKISIKEIQTFYQPTPFAEAGDNVGLLVSGYSKDDITRGQCIVQPKTHTAHNKFKGIFYVLDKEEGGRGTGFKTGYEPQFFIATADITGTVVLPEKIEFALPGDTIEMLVDLKEFVCLKLGQKISVREGNRTVAAGKVTELL